MNEDEKQHKLLFEAYKRVLREPPHQLEMEFIISTYLLYSYLDHLPKGSRILDMGWGIVRPLKHLAKKYPDKQYFGIDISDEILEEAEKIKYLDGLSNICLFKDNALDTIFKDNSFDLTYSTYNVIGSLEKKDRNTLIKEKARVTKKGGKIITATWVNDAKTTAFLAKYYLDLGAELKSVSKFKTETSFGTFYRLPINYIKNLYQKNNIKPIESRRSGTIWTYIVGEKQ